MPGNFNTTRYIRLMRTEWKYILTIVALAYLIFWWTGCGCQGQLETFALQVLYQSPSIPGASADVNHLLADINKTAMQMREDSKHDTVDRRLL